MSRTRTLLPLIAAALLWNSPALADTITLTLTGMVEDGIGDRMGTTAYTDGVVKKGGTAVGTFNLITRRNTVDHLDTGPAQLTLLFPVKGGNHAPESVVMEGVFDFISGDFKGGVSTASNAYKWARDASAAYVPVVKSPPDLRLVIEGPFSGVTLP